MREAIEHSFSERLQFVLGTESGMITSIVRTVQGLLQDAQRPDIQVEVVFPVSSEAITTEAQVGSLLLGKSCASTLASPGAYLTIVCRSHIVC